jgi:hypothetical protein
VQTEKQSDSGSEAGETSPQRPVTPFAILPSLQELKTKGIPYVLCGLLGLALISQVTRKPDIEIRTETQIKEVVKVVEVEKEVVKWREKLVIETRPDGSTSRTEEREGTKVVDIERLATTIVDVKKKDEILVSKNLSRYSLGVSVILDLDKNPTYFVEGGARLGNLPLFVKLIVGSNLSLGLGLNYEF